MIFGGIELKSVAIKKAFEWGWKGFCIIFGDWKIIGVNGSQSKWKTLPEGERERGGKLNGK